MGGRRMMMLFRWEKDDDVILVGDRMMMLFCWEKDDDVIPVGEG